MPKATALNVAVTANTSQFDAKMAKVRAQLKQTQQAASMAGATGLAGPMGGRIGAFAGVMGLSGPMMAVAAATAGLASIIQSERARQDRNAARGVENFNEILASRMGIAEQARLKTVAQLASPDGSAGDVKALLGAVRPRDMQSEQKLMQAGMTQGDLSALAGATDTEALKLLVDLSRSPAGLEIAKALGGKAGTMFGNLARIADVSNIDRAMGLDTVGINAQRAAKAEMERQAKVAGVDPNLPELPLGMRERRYRNVEEERFLLGLTDPKVVEYLNRLEANSGKEPEPVSNRVMPQPGEDTEQYRYPRPWTQDRPQQTDPKMLEYLAEIASNTANGGPQ